MFMNENDVDEAVRLLGSVESPALPYAQYLAGWRDVVNSNSDGWPYWEAGRKPAKKLMTLVSQAVDADVHNTWQVESPNLEDLRKAVTTIKSAATRLGLPHPDASNL